MKGRPTTAAALKKAKRISRVFIDSLDRGRVPLHIPNTGMWTCATAAEGLLGGLGWGYSEGFLEGEGLAGGGGYGWRGVREMKNSQMGRKVGIE